MLRSLCVLGSLVSCSLLIAGPLELHVSPQGHDAHSGRSAEEALLTLDAARDLIRREKQLDRFPAEGAEVILHAGEHRLAETFFLERTDSGTSAGPIVYRAAQPGRVSITGCRDVRGFRRLDEQTDRERFPASSREAIRYADLRAQGIVDFGTLAPRSAVHPLAPAPLELTLNDHPLRLAQWPNEGFAEAVIAAAGAAAPAKLQLQEMRALGASSLRDAWIQGDWQTQNIDSCEPIAAIESVSRTITLKTSLPAARTGAAIHYRLLNLPEELDQPGEYYLDREKGLLYVYAERESELRSAHVTHLKTLVCCDDASHIEFRDLTFTHARVTGLELLDGRSIRAVGCTFTHHGNLAASISGGRSHELLDCTVRHTGDGGVRVEGGDPQSRTSADHSVHGCRFENYARSELKLRPAVYLFGYGNEAKGNEFAAGPVPAVLSFGEGHRESENVVRDR